MVHQLSQDQPRTLGNFEATCMLLLVQFIIHNSHLAFHAKRGSHQRRIISLLTEALAYTYIPVIAYNALHSVCIIVI